ncbi:MAG: hypothetical protein O3B01_15375 [Planctomycetota bacterium]|nr:hypothetical protein [Planctomycetota bacterium]
MAFSNIGFLPNFNAFALPLQPINTGIGSDVFRTGNQSQNIGQIARSFSGADTQNDLVQQADQDRSASATNFKDIDVTAPTGAANFVNGEPQTTSIELAGPKFARIGGAFFQDQGVNQYGFAQGVDFEGNPSRAGNSVSQGSNQNTTLNADTILNVTAPTNLDTDQPVSTTLNVGNGGLLAGVQQGIVQPASEVPVAPPSVVAALETPISPVSLETNVFDLLTPAFPTPVTPQPQSSAVPFLSLPIVGSVSARDVTNGLRSGLSLANSPSFIFPASIRNNIASLLSPGPVLSGIFRSVNFLA